MLYLKASVGNDTKHFKKVLEIFNGTPCSFGQEIQLYAHRHYSVVSRFKAKRKQWRQLCLHAPEEQSTFLRRLPSRYHFQLKKVEFGLGLLTGHC